MTDGEHGRFREAIFADELIDGLREHMAACGECRDLAARLERMDRMYREAPVPPPRASLLADILAAGPEAGEPGEGLRPEAASERPETVGIRVNLPAHVWEAWQSAADAEGLDRTEFARRALSVAVYLFEQRRKGRTILIYDPPTGPLAKFREGTFHEVAWADGAGPARVLEATRRAAAIKAQAAKDGEAR